MSKNKAAIDIINENNGGRMADHTENWDHIPYFLNDHDYMFQYNNLSQYKFEIIKYISGFVKKKLQASLKCEHCIDVLQGNKLDLLYSRITYKSKGWLTYPSEDVINILCSSCEKYLELEARK